MGLANMENGGVVKSICHLSGLSIHPLKPMDMVGDEYRTTQHSHDGILSDGKFTIAAAPVFSGGSIVASSRMPPVDITQFYTERDRS